MAGDEVEIMWAGRYIEARHSGAHEFVGRASKADAVAILAIETGHVILVEQPRASLGGRCIELPAGLVGDDVAGEAVAAAAARELEEETGYRAERIEEIGRFASAPGLLAETFVLVRAHGLTKVGHGGGDATERITVHRVPLDGVDTFLAERRARGCQVDGKLLLLLAAGILSAG